MQLKLLVSPLARSAYFGDYLNVSGIEFQALFPNIDFTIEQQGGLDFLCFELAGNLQSNAEDEAKNLARLARLSFFQAVFEVKKDQENGGLYPLMANAGYQLPEEYVFGTKYAGKTNELVTQLALNLAIEFADLSNVRVPKLLDPMAGRGSTLLWAARYGCDALGIEQDATALAGFQLHIKKQSKLLRIKQRQQEGFIGKANRQNLGKYLQFELAASTVNSASEASAENRSLRLICGDSAESRRLIQNRTVNLIVSDLPYGVAHFTTAGTRNPLAALESCADEWLSCLRKGGAMVLIFNRYQPKREALIKLFVERGLAHQEFSAPHRMSESIVRDFVIFTRT